LLDLGPARGATSWITVPLAFLFLAVTTWSAGDSIVKCLAHLVIEGSLQGSLFLDPHPRKPCYKKTNFSFIFTFHIKNPR
jgi:hypothetical protein